MKRTLVLLSALAALGLVGGAHAQMQAQRYPGPGPLPGPIQGNWRLLAFKTVGAGTDRDVIRVNANRVWRQLQLCSINAPIQMLDFRVNYGNGRSENVNLRSRIGAGTCTRAIDLRGGARRIVSINLTYGKLDRSMRVPLIRVMSR
jgi:hypothetical protein